MNETYKGLLESHSKAETFFNDPDRSVEEKEFYLGGYIELVARLNELYQEDEAK